MSTRTACLHRVAAPHKLASTCVASRFATGRDRLCLSETIVVELNPALPASWSRESGRAGGHLTQKAIICNCRGIYDAVISGRAKDWVLVLLICPPSQDWTDDERWE